MNEHYRMGDILFNLILIICNISEIFFLILDLIVESFKHLNSILLYISLILACLHGSSAHYKDAAENVTVVGSMIPCTCSATMCILMESRFRLGILCNQSCTP